jgi:hypothetical protein
MRKNLFLLSVIILTFTLVGCATDSFRTLAGERSYAGGRYKNMDHVYAHNEWAYNRGAEPEFYEVYIDKTVRRYNGLFIFRDDGSRAYLGDGIALSVITTEEEMLSVKQKIEADRQNKERIAQENGFNTFDEYLIRKVKIIAVNEAKEFYYAYMNGNQQNISSICYNLRYSQERSFNVSAIIYLFNSNDIYLNLGYTNFTLDSERRVYSSTFIGTILSELKKNMPGTYQRLYYNDILAILSNTGNYYGED